MIDATFLEGKSKYPSPIKNKFIKRLFDIVFSFLVIVLGLPIFVILVFIVLFSSKGPIFYISKRVGINGKQFKLYKFRTMYIDADQKIEKIINEDKELFKEWIKYRKLKKDPRVTPIGHFLRKTSLDELPQFFNVFKGNLSVVGPRPFFLNEIIEIFPKKAPKILSVKPGITGLWQTSGRNNLTIIQRVDCEEKYIDTYSFKNDLFLICKTIPLMFPHKEK